MTATLKPCPACGGEVTLQGHRDRYVACHNDACKVTGPAFDPDGEKWNAMCARMDVNNAAPNLLAACEIALSRLEKAANNVEVGDLSDIRAAIRKARGER